MSELIRIDQHPQPYHNLSEFDYAQNSACINREINNVNDAKSLIIESSNTVGDFLQRSINGKEGVETNPQLLPPKNDSERLSSEEKDKLLNTASELQDNSLVLTAALASTAAVALSSAIASYNSDQYSNILILKNDSAKTFNDKSSDNLSFSSTTSRAHASVEAGTDIKPVDDNETISFTNMMDTLLLEALDKYMLSGNEAEKMFNLTSSKFSTLAVDTAKQSAQKEVDAAETNLTASIAGGVAGLGMHATGAFKSGKAINNEMKSVDNKLRPALDRRTAMTKHNNAIRHNHDHMSNKQPLDTAHEAALKHQHVDQIHHAQTDEFDHQLQVHATQKARVHSEVIIQGGRAVDSTLQSGINIEASQQRGEAKVLDSNKTIQEQVSANEREIAKERHDAVKSMIDILMAKLKADSDAISGMSDKI